MLRSEDWQGIILFTALSVFVGLKAVSLSKSGSHGSAWGGWLWMPVFVAQGLGVFLVCRTNGSSGSASMYEFGMVLHIVCCAGLIVVIFLLHHTTHTEAAMICSFVLLFAVITTICVFFTVSIGGGLLYALTGLLVPVICYKSISIALSKPAQSSPTLGSTDSPS